MGAALLLCATVAGGQEAIAPVPAHSPASVAAVAPLVKHLGYSGSVHGIWSAQGCTGCHLPAHPSLDLTGSASQVYPRVVQFPRVDTGSPPSSLILTKPQPGTVSHDGGDFPCFAPGSSCYDTILHWIQEGAPFSPCSYALAPTSRSHGAGAGSGSITVTAGSGCAWSAVANKPWIHVTGGATGSGNGTVSYAIDANPLTTARSGAITVAGLTFTISQAAAAACSYAIAPPNAAYGSGGGAGTVAVSVAAGCAWTAVSNAPWIHVTGGAAGSGNGTVSYTVDANASAAARAGSLTIAGHTFAVSQGGASVGCQANATTLCLGGGRFSVTAQWRTAGGQSGAGTAVVLTSDTGYFWFFAATNLEVMVKVLDACTFNDRFWFFGTGLTDVEVTVTLRDLTTGESKTYVNPLGVPFAPIQDTAALTGCG